MDTKLLKQDIQAGEYSLFLLGYELKPSARSRASAGADRKRGGSTVVDYKLPAGQPVNKYSIVRASEVDRVIMSLTDSNILVHLINRNMGSTLEERHYVPVISQYDEDTRENLTHKIINSRVSGDLLRVYRAPEPPSLHVLNKMLENRFSNDFGKYNQLKEFFSENPPKVARLKVVPFQKAEQLRLV